MRRFLLTLTMVVMLPLTGECADFQLSNSNSTDETQWLANDLSGSMLNTTSIRYGEQYIRSSTNSNLFDTVNVVGKYPYIYGDGFQFTNELRQYHFRNHAVQGGIVTLYWSMQNWVTGGDQYDETGDPVVNIITGGANVNDYQEGLDELAEFLNNFKYKDGTLIPVIFRPFHEGDGSWFWWGTDTCTDAQYKQLWQETYDYITTTKGVNNIIWCYAPEYIDSTSVDRYPGDNYVDIMGVDRYTNNDIATAITAYGLCYDEAISNGKIFAITEGLQRLADYPDVDYWTTLATAILGDSKAQKAAYIMIWTRDKWGVNSERSDASNFSTAVSNGSFDLIEYSYSTISSEGDGTVSLTTQGEGTVTIQ